MQSTSPRSPESTISFSFCTPGWYSRRWPGISTRPRSSASSQSSSISAPRIAGGFSTKTCLPASSARRASSWWVGTGVATTTASTESSASRSSKFDVKRAEYVARQLGAAFGVDVAKPYEVGELVEVAREVLSPLADPDLGYT